MRRLGGRVKSRQIRSVGGNRPFFLCVSFLLLFLIVAGLSYAFLSLTLFGEKKLNVIAGTLAVDFKEGNNGITLENIIPTADEEGMKMEPYEFSIENTGTIEAKYDLLIEDDHNEQSLRYEYLKFSLKKNDEEWTAPRLLSDLDSLALEQSVLIEPKEKNHYALKLWLDIDAGNDAQGKKFQGRIVVNVVQSNATTGDITPPMIHLAGNLSMNVEENSAFTDPGVESVTDNKDTLDKNDVRVSYEYYDGETTKTVDSVDTSKRGVYYIYYRISDKSGNEGLNVRSVNVYKEGTEPPVIRLNGDSPMAVEKDATYTDPGATAISGEEDLTSRIVVVGTVNTKRIGSYQVKYLVTDANGNTSSIVRVVNVVSTSGLEGEITLDLNRAPTRKITLSGENLGELTYTSNDESIATVDSNGNVTGKRIGETTVTITSSTGLHKTVKVKVQKTVDIVYVKQGTGVSSIGKEKDHCVITSGDSCSVSAPEISVESGYTIVGWNTSSSATAGTAVGEKITLSSNVTYYAISYKNAITYTVYFNANGNTVSATSKSCTIPAAYNNNVQSPGCDITTPIITAPSVTPTVIGYNQVAGTHTSQVGSNASLTVYASNNGKTYYAQTTKEAVTRSVTYSKESGVSAIGKSSDSCSITATYNGMTQASSCNVTLPSITSLVGYNTSFWSTSSSATNGTAAGTSISLSSNVTYYARALDTTKPVWSLVSVSPTSGTVNPSTTVTFTFKGTDTSGTVTSSLVPDNITVKAGDVTVSPATKTLSTATSVINGKQYTLTLSGIEEDGVVAIILSANTLKDGSNNGNNTTTLSSQVTIENPFAYYKIFKVSNLGSTGSLNFADSEQTFITGAEPNNYVWYSGKLWRAVSKDTSDNSVKLVTQWSFATLPYGSSTAYNGSNIQKWLNDTSVDGFLGNLRNYSTFIKTDSKWNATETVSVNKPPQTTMVTNAVGLLNAYEYVKTYDGTIYADQATNYLNNGTYWWTLTPYDSSTVRTVYNNGKLTMNEYLWRMHGIRPAINLKSSIKITAGNGTEGNPYRLSGDNTTPTSGTLLNTRYSGEYVRFGSGNNNLYRIVSHESGGAKLVSAEPLKENTSFLTKKFNLEYRKVLYTPTDSTYQLAYWLNHTYLTASNNYLTSTQISMIESKPWYLGTVGRNENYRLAKYSSATGTTLTSSKVSAKVGLLRHGELLSGQYQRYSSKENPDGVTGLLTDYWLLTPYDSEYIHHILPYGLGNSYDVAPSTSLGVRPVVNLKSTIQITGGNGTKTSPFTISN